MVNWKNGEYEFIIGAVDDDYSATIQVRFTIDKNGIVSYNEPEIWQ